MEWLSGSATSSSCHAVRRKRSNSRRRPHPNPKLITDDQNVLTFQSSPVYYQRSDDNHHDRSKEPLLESDCLGNEKKLKKVKLKLGGITRTVRTKFVSENPLGNAPVTDISKNENHKHDPVYKSKRIFKKHTVDEGSNDEDDEEIRYLKKLRASKAKKTPKLMDMGLSETYGPPGFGIEGKKKLKMHKDIDYELELTSDDELKRKRRNAEEDYGNPVMESGQEMTITTRKRALECPEFGGLVEFPNGLPTPSSKKQKLSEVEQQLRKAEAAQRRRLQAEKAAKEAEAEAIRKIRGQDSNRKKKEEKLKKQQQELAKEKTDKAAALGLNTVRLIMGPNGTVVTFSEDIGLPKIFDPRPYRYPPPREKCVGPNCTNEYKYRDSKLKLPLCSLHCYKAVQGNMEVLPAC